MIDVIDIFLIKANESLAGADSEFANGRYNNCVNRCYYACFQAAIYALSQSGIRSSGARPRWGHDFVQAQFIGQLINRRKLYSTDLRDVLLQTLILRQAADYSTEIVTQTRMQRTLRRAREFIIAIESGGDNQ